IGTERPTIHHSERTSAALLKLLELLLGKKSRVLSKIPHHRKGDDSCAQGWLYSPVMAEVIGWGRLAAPLLLGLGMLACGGVKAPQTEMATAQSAVRAAEVGGAEEIPKGKLHLKYAREA